MLSLLPNIYSTQCNFRRFGIATSTALLEKSVFAIYLVRFDCFWPACQRVLKGIPQHEPAAFIPRWRPPVFSQVGIAGLRNPLPVDRRDVLHWHDGAPTMLSSIFDGGCKAINFQHPFAGLMPHKVIEPALVDQPVKRRPAAVSKGFGCVT